MRETAKPPYLQWGGLTQEEIKEKGKLLALNLALASETFSANKNDWTPASLKAVQRITPSGASRDLTGIAGLVLDGNLIWIINVDTTNNVVLKHESASSSAANRIIGIAAADVTIAPGEKAQLLYDGTTQRWRVLYKQ